MATALPERPIAMAEALGKHNGIEAGWWQHGDSSRDYYLARTPEAAARFLLQAQFSA